MPLLLRGITKLLPDYKIYVIIYSMKKNCKVCNKEFNKPNNESLLNWNTRHLYCSQKCKIKSMNGRKFSVEINAKKGRKGQTVSEETRRKISESKKGSKSHFWQGGLTEINKLKK